MKHLKCLFFCLALCTISCKKGTEFSATKASGIIKEQGVSTYMYGTHILTDHSGGTLYALQSEAVNLDKYIDKEVEIKGNKVKGYPVDGGPEYLEVSSVK